MADNLPSGIYDDLLDSERNNCSVPFTYLGPTERVSFEDERPIKMVWKLRYRMPVSLFEENRRGG